MANTSMQEKDLKETGGLNNKKTLIRETISYFDQYRFPKDVKNYKQYLGFNLDRLQAIEDWQSNISYPIGASIVNSTFANMYDFGYEFGVLDDGFRQLLNETFDYKNQGKICLGHMIKEGLITGKSFCKVSLMTETVTIKLFGDKTITTTVKKPSVRYVPKFNVFYDHDYQVNESPFQIERMLLSGDAILKKYKGILSETDYASLGTKLNKNSEINKSDISTNSGFSSFDFNPVKDILNYQNSIINEIRGMKAKKDKVKTVQEVIGFFLPYSLGTFGGESNKQAISAKNLFKYDKAKSYEILEYMENDEITLFINGEEIGKFNLFDSGVGKIYSIEFNSVPGTSESLGIMDMIGDLQALLDSIWNSFIDNIKLQLSGMFKVTGNIDGLGLGSTMKFQKFGLIKLKGQSDIQRFEMGLGDFMPLNMVQYLDGFISKVIGVNDYQLGGQHKVERVADGIDFMRSQYKSKLAVMIDSIQRLMSIIAREWLIIYLTRFTQKELTDKGFTFTEEGEGEDKNYKINGISIRDILSEEHITFTYNALETIDMERDREKIAMLYQALAQNGNVDIDQLWNVVLGKKFTNIWKSGKSPTEYNKGEVEKELKKQNYVSDSENTIPPGTPVPGNPIDMKYDETVGTLDMIRKNQPPLNELDIEHTPSGAKVQKQIHKLTTSDITDRLSI